MFTNYERYLRFINSKIDKFFERQKPYIFCQKGCAKCCKNAEFPFSLIELKYLLTGFLTLDKETQSIIEKNLEKVKQERAENAPPPNTQGSTFRYDCPFLINDVCSVYEYRGVICRSFGLLSSGEDGRVKVPFCCYEGYNYSNVIDMETKMISGEKVKAGNFPEQPLAFNVRYNYLTDPDFEKEFQFEFGDKKPLIEWFTGPIEDEPKN